MATAAPKTYSRIALEFQPPASRITLNNPPINVIDLPMMDDLAHALAEIESRSDVSAVVIRGGDHAFSAGVDIAAHKPDQVREMLAKFHAVIRALAHTKKVTIAAVRRVCMGGGAELALMCDVVITGDQATWQFPEIKLGCFPPVAAVALAAVVGQKRAADLLLTGRLIKGDEAAAIGLANVCVPGPDVEQHVEKVLERLRSLSPAALAMAKKAFYAWDAIHFDKGLARSEDIYLNELMKTEDAREGINAFLEKRDPVWKGR